MSCFDYIIYVFYVQYFVILLGLQYKFNTQEKNNDLRKKLRVMLKKVYYKKICIKVWWTS